MIPNRGEPRSVSSRTDSRLQDVRGLTATGSSVPDADRHLALKGRRSNKIHAMASPLSGLDRKKSANRGLSPTAKFRRHLVVENNANSKSVIEGKRLSG